MSTHPPSFPERPSPSDASAHTEAHYDRSRPMQWDVTMQIAIHADARRVFHALTIPEYREAWITPPACDERCYVEASGGEDGYRIDFYRAGVLDVSIIGVYRKSHPEEMFFTWHKEGAPDPTSSLVHIRLLDGAGHTILKLHHTGFPSAAERFWHQTMWRDSLEKLTWLLEYSHP